MLHWTKVFSGRFIFAVVTALVFAYAVYTKQLGPDKIYEIIIFVIGFYFGKNQVTNGKPEVS